MTITLAPHEIDVRRTPPIFQRPCGNNAAMACAKRVKNLLQLHQTPARTRRHLHCRGVRTAVRKPLPATAAAASPAASPAAQQPTSLSCPVCQARCEHGTRSGKNALASAS